VYELIGGFYVSKKVPKKHKYLWATFNALGLVAFALVPMAYYGVTHWSNPIDITDLIEGFIGMTIIAAIAIPIPLFTIYFSKNIEKVIDYMENSRDKELEFQCTNLVSMPKNLRRSSSQSISSTTSYDIGTYSSVFIKYRNSFIFPFVQLLWGVLFNIIFLSLPIMFVTFIHKDRPYLLQHYVLPIIFYDRKPSLGLYYLISIIQMVPMIVFIIVGTSQGIFPVLYVLIMNNIIFKYCKHINTLSKTAHEFLERNICTRDSETFAKFIRSFEADLALSVLRYQELTE
jgi:uncharacterized membrane protein